jgi:hypothetical protein
MAYGMGRMTKRNRAKYRRRAHAAAGVLRTGLLRVVAIDPRGPRPVGESGRNGNMNRAA